jgi:hypothetical protein
MKINACKKWHEKNKELLTHLLNDGWKVDVWGHAKKVFQENGEEKTFRMKFCKTLVRFEMLVQQEATKYTKKSTTWVRKKSIPYKDISIPS